MKKVRFRGILLILTILISTLCFSGCAQKTEQADTKSNKNITICAAASLKEAFDEIKPKFEAEKGIKLTYNFGASGTLQKQIEEGAPADVFISAGKKQMDALEGKKLVDKESRKNLLNNKLVLIVPNEQKDKIKTVSDLVGKDVKISIGQPESVPAGQYAKDSLTYLKLWDNLSNKVVYAKDVKQVVAYVEKGEVAAGFVYNSDATVLKNSSIVQVIDEKSHKPIAYPEAIVSASKDKESAKAFLEYLNTDTAKQIFKKYGFDVDMK